MKAPRSWPLITPLGTAAKLSRFPPQHPLYERAGGDDVVGVLGGVVEGVFDDGFADVAVAQRVWHVGAGEIEGLGARFRIKEVGFRAVAASGTVLAALGPDRNGYRTTHALSCRERRDDVHPNEEGCHG